MIRTSPCTQARTRVQPRAAHATEAHVPEGAAVLECAGCLWWLGPQSRCRAPAGHPGRRHVHRQRKRARLAPPLRRFASGVCPVCLCRAAGLSLSFTCMLAGRQRSARRSLCAELLEAWLIERIYILCMRVSVRIVHVRRVHAHITRTRTSTHMSRPAHSRSSPVDTPDDTRRTPHIPVVASVACRVGSRQPWAALRPPLV